MMMMVMMMVRFQKSHVKIFMESIYTSRAAVEEAILVGNGGGSGRSSSTSGGGGGGGGGGDGSCSCSNYYIFMFACFADIG